MQAEREDSRCLRFCQGPSPITARYIYAVLFLACNISAWLVRENHVQFYEGQRINGCLGDRDCLAAEVVLIISLASFLFFLVMFLSTMYTSNVHDPRNIWHCHWWIAKGVLLMASFIISTLAPTYIIQLYGKAAHFGAGAFLFIQLLSVMRFITRLNCKWCLTDFEKCHLKIIAVSIIAYSASMVVIILMAMWYTACWLNIAFIGSTLLMVYLLPLISLKSKAKGYYMEPGLVSAYIVYMCYSAISSEPKTNCSYNKGSSSGVHYWKTIGSFVFALIGTAYATYSTGKDYKCIQLRNVQELEEDVPYSYGFFHFIFATGSMYFAMLFVGWDTHHIMKEKLSVDISWTSTWVHVVNEGLTVILFVAILVARIYGIGWLRQLLGPIFGHPHSDEMSNNSNSNTNNYDEEEGLRGPPPSPQMSTTTSTTQEEEEELVEDEILSCCSVDNTGPPPSFARVPQDQPRKAQEINN